MNGISSKLVPEIASAILDAKRSGSSNARAAAAGGVTTRTLQLWLARGKRGKQLYAEFSAAFMAAERAAIDERIESLKAAFSKNDPLDPPT